MTIERRPLADRFREKVAAAGPNDCWEWTAYRLRNGYGSIGIGGNRGSHLLAHRVAYEMEHGSIPDGFVIDHLCRNRGCVNPAHLEAVDNRTNLLRGVGASAANARKTQCPKGHEYTGTNARGDRMCHVCAAENARRYKAAKRAERAA